MPKTISEYRISGTSKSINVIIEDISYEIYPGYIGFIGIKEAFSVYNKIEKPSDPEEAEFLKKIVSCAAPDHIEAFLKLSPNMFMELSGHVMKWFGDELETLRNRSDAVLTDPTRT